MTLDKKQRLLIEMYEGLAFWPWPQEHEYFDMTPLVQHCLNIISLMCEHDRHVRPIAKSLMIITRSQSEQALHESIKQALVEVENKLPASQQGFSKLFDLILCENALRVDTQDLVQRLPMRFQELAGIFEELIHCFDVYDELNTLCDAENPKAITAMFLCSLAKILERELLPESIINSWLIAGNKDKQIINNFSNRFNYIKTENINSDLCLIIFLCLCSANNILIPKDSVEQLELALKRAHYPELQAFIDWGFLRAELTGFTTRYENDFVAKNLYVV